MKAASHRLQQDCMIALARHVEVFWFSLMQGSTRGSPGVPCNFSYEQLLHSSAALVGKSY